MDLIETLCNFSEEVVVNTVSEVESLLNKKINSSDTDKVKLYITELSAYKGRLVNIEFQMYRQLTEKEFQALEEEIMTGKSKEIRDIQLINYTKEEKGNYKLIKTLREEVNNKLMLAQSILKSVDLRVNGGL